MYTLPKIFRPLHETPLLFYLRLLVYLNIQLDNERKQFKPRTNLSSQIRVSTISDLSIT